MYFPKAQGPPHIPLNTIYNKNHIIIYYLSLHNCPECPMFPHSTKKKYGNTNVAHYPQDLTYQHKKYFISLKIFLYLYFYILHDVILRSLLLFFFLLTTPIFFSELLQHLTFFIDSRFFFFIFLLIY